MKYIKLYFFFAKLSIRQELVHRASFLTGVIGQWLAYGTTFLTLFFTINYFGTLGLWEAHEVTFLYAFNLLSYAIGACVFFNPCTTLATKIRTGEFDAALTKPVTPFVHEIFNGFNFGYIGHTILSVVVMILSISQIEGFVTASNMILFFVLLLCSALIQAALLIFSSSFSFVTLNKNPILNILAYNIKSFIDYPITIYHVSIQILLTFIFPVAFINFYPSVLLLDAPNSQYFPEFVPYLTLPISILLFIFSIWFWNRSLSKYQSAGT